MPAAKNCGRFKKEDVLKWIDEANNGRYTFNRDFEYRAFRDKLECKCTQCGETFYRRFESLKKGSGCISCSKRRPKQEQETQSQVEANLKRIANGKWTWKPFIYFRQTQRIELICLKCDRTDEWTATINQIYQSEKDNGMNCKYCSRLKRSKVMTKEDIIRRCTEVGKGRFIPIDDGWEYDDKADNKMKIKFQCLNPKCNNVYECSINNALNHQRGCPKCCNRVFSRAEKEIVAQIRKHFPDLEVLENQRIIPSAYSNSKMEIDILIPSIKLGVEYNGNYWHSDKMLSERTNGHFKTAEEYHSYKSKECEKQGIKLVHLSEDVGEIDYILGLIGDLTSIS